MARKSHYKFNSAAPSPALSKRSAPATPMSVTSRAGRLNQDEAAKRHNARSKAAKSNSSSFNRLDDGYGKVQHDALPDAAKQHYGRCRDGPSSHQNESHAGESPVPSAYEMQEALRCKGELALRSPNGPRCRLK